MSKPGQVLAPRSTITLGNGDQITLIGSDGQSSELIGPLAKVLRQGTSLSLNGNTLVSTISELLTKGTGSKKEGTLGATRGASSGGSGTGGKVRANQGEAPPDPWFLNIIFDDTFCVKGSSATLWRNNSSSTLRLSIKNSQTGKRQNIKWSAGKRKLIWKIPSLSKNPVTYLFRFSTSPSPRKFSVQHFSPHGSTLGQMVAELVAAGCPTQAMALLRSMQK